jgi:hypothetical protein
MTSKPRAVRNTSSGRFGGPAVHWVVAGALVAAFLIAGCGGGSSTTTPSTTKPDRDAALREHKDNPTHPTAALREHKDNPTLNEHKDNPTQGEQTVK